MIRRLILLCIAALVVVTVVGGVPVEVSVESRVNGSLSYLAYEKNVTGLQSFTVQWYNLASASCTTRFAFHMANASTGQRVDTAWTNGYAMHPGESRAFHAFWLPPADGTYTVTMRIFHCFTVVEEPVDGFTVTNSGNQSAALSLELENQPNAQLSAQVTANRSVNDVYVLPVDSPAGWVFPAAAVSAITETQPGAATVNYTPSAWSQETVTYRAVTADAEYASEPVTVQVKKETAFWTRHGTRVLATIIIALTLTLLYVVTRQ